MKGQKWTRDKKYADAWHSRYGEMVDYWETARALDVKNGWYYWAAGASVPKGPFETRQQAQRCGDRPKPRRKR